MSTEIAWTDETWNPTVGCSRVSPGCDNCYAEKVARRAMQPAHAGLVGTDGRWTGEVRLLPDRLDTPLHWRKPRRVFVDSMSDLFHPDVPETFLHDVFAVMAATPQHTYQVLTKRPQRMSAVVGATWERLGIRSFESHVEDRIGAWISQDLEVHWPLPNVWLGTSVETQRYADLRIPHLLETPAAVRFLSIEPLLGPVDLMGAVEPDWIGGPTGGSGAPHPLIDWVIVGGESGPGHREMAPDWLASIVDECDAAGVPVFVKQDSGARSGQQGRIPDDIWKHKEFPS
jgi:protein gp37